MAGVQKSEKEVFFEALELPTDAPAVFVAEECGDDVARRDRILALVRAHDSNDHFLADNGPPSKAGVPPWPEIDDSLEGPGDRIGPYLLHELLGEGGFGAVYRARQESPVRRDVALKILKPGMDTRQIVARFNAERQVLALMDHPCIAIVFDAGSTEGGRPYFVMEYVRGEPVTSYCDRKNLSLRERLELFSQICQAVQHAHQKGVIHRDLKPNNILVAVIDGRPVPKIIDFGIAKATEGRVDDGSLFTKAYQLLGTPEYMPPEQAALSGVDIDTRADIYSLGVLLYELLAGVGPYDAKKLRRASPVELERIIQEEQPQKPSTRVAALGDSVFEIALKRKVEPPRLYKEIRGDLDWIVMRAIEKDRNRRYPTANALAADVQRYLACEPVEAGPPGAVYRLGKFYHRHRLATITVLLVALVLVTAAGVSTFFAALATSARNDARQLQQTAERQSYIATLSATAAALRDNNGLEARRYLDTVPASLREWEWRYFDNLVDQSRFTLKPIDGRADMMAFSPDDSKIAVSWQDHLIRIYDPETGELQQTLYGHTGRINSLQYSPDGLRLYSGSHQAAELFAWDTETGQLITSLGSQINITTLDLSRDGVWLVSASRDGTVRLWDTRTYESVRGFDSHDGPVSNTRISPDGSRILTVGWDQTFKLWNTHTGQEIASAYCARESTSMVPPKQYAPGQIGFVDFNFDGTLFATGTRDGVLSVWNGLDGSLLWTDRDSRALIRYISFSPDGSRLAVARIDETFSLYEPTSGDLVSNVTEHADDVRYVGFTPDSRFLVTTSEDHTLRIWHADDGRSYRTLRGHHHHVWRAAISYDGNRLASFSEDNTVKIWHVGGLLPQTIHEYEGALRHLAASEQGDFIVTSEIGRPPRVWNTDTLEPRFILDAKSGGVEQSAVSPDGTFVATAENGRAVTLWNAETGSEIRTLEGHDGAVVTVRFSTDGTLLASGSQDRTARIWSVATGEELLLLPGHGSTVQEVEFGLDGDRLITVSSDRNVRIWHLMSGRLIKIIPISGEGYSHSLALSPDGKTFVASAGGREINMVELATGRVIRKLLGHGEAVISLAWLPDGSRVVSGSRDRTVRLWDPETGDNVAILRGHESHVQCVAVSADGATIFSGGADRTLRLWSTAGNR